VVHPVEHLVAVVYMELAIALQIMIVVIWVPIILLYGVQVANAIGREQVIMIHLAVIKVVI
jgi:ABC-type sulfate transport system permease subunit